MLGLDWVMVFKATFNNISVISWRSVLLVVETVVPGETNRPVTDNIYHIMFYRIHLSTLTPRQKRDSNFSGNMHRWHRSLQSVMVFFCENKWNRIILNHTVFLLPSTFFEDRYLKSWRSFDQECWDYMDFCINSCCTVMV